MVRIMARKSKDPNGFDQKSYMYEWSKENMKSISCRYKSDFVDEFKEACKILGLKQSDVIREAAAKTIELAKIKSCKKSQD